MLCHDDIRLLPEVQYSVLQRVFNRAAGESALFGTEPRDKKNKQLVIEIYDLFILSFGTVEYI